MSGIINPIALQMDGLPRIELYRILLVHRTDRPVDLETISEQMIAVGIHDVPRRMFEHCAFQNI